MRVRNLEPRMNADLNCLRSTRDCKSFAFDKHVAEFAR
jgi:hypothetical protein